MERETEEYKKNKTAENSREKRSQKQKEKKLNYIQWIERLILKFLKEIVEARRQ